MDSIKSLVTTHTNHPLVRTAILIYTMPHLRPKLHKVLQANLGVADSAPPSMAAFMGYLILAHIPQVKEELVTSIDVSCAAIRGMGQAMALGLDDTVHAVTQPGFDWTIEMESIERLSAVSSLHFSEQSPEASPMREPTHHLVSNHNAECIALYHESPSSMVSPHPYIPRGHDPRYLI